jgi:hypothetical protein
LHRQRRRQRAAEAERAGVDDPERQRRLVPGNGERGGCAWRGADRACGYSNGRGHPLAFARSTFSELAVLHGDRGVWKLLDGAGDDVVDVAIPGPVPLDVDTWEDYQKILAAADAPG